MGNLETGKDKIQKICDTIRKETLDPVRQEVREMIENARLEAAEILRDAEEKAKELRNNVDQEIEEKRRLFEASLHLSCRQGIETLKQKIEQTLFNRELAEMIIKETSEPGLITQIIESFMRSLETQGIEEDFEVLIPKSISPRSINALLTKKILERLKHHSVEIGDFQGGVQIRIKGRQITIDISDEVIRELISSYIRRDFRALIFEL